ncbi:helix-turn-helix transcriptional regulator [Paracoccus onubensis]|uniref:helix-turn-helix domain-containing protein n=1 Tax=Paracoccus onubensis TaxID=1675788 RepID=UPI002730A295|nr:helix-turn-helix transcriptional regulator [Paracoccus onubensis]MDP0930180.1 helix-turn-helix transcriptional regulator [Paracoccus onubensis]
MEDQDRHLLTEAGHRLRQARLARGLNLHQLARLTGISAPALSLIETGKRDPRLTTLGKIATALRFPLADLLENPPGVTTVKQAPYPEGDGYDLGDYE